MEIEELAKVAAVQLFFSDMDEAHEALAFYEQLMSDGEEGPWTHKDVSPSVEALPLDAQFLEA